MNAKKKTAAVALAAAFACGALAGCDALTVQNINEDYDRTVATVNISSDEDFKEGGLFAGLSDIVGDASIAKRELVLSFLSNGSTLVQSYGMSVSEAFDFLLDNLIRREVNVQYAKAYLTAKGDADGGTYTKEGYITEVGKAGAEASEEKKEAAGLGYFLTQAEKDKALYDLRVAINSAIDNQEQGLIKASEDEHDHTADSDVRTLPTGAETVSEDFYDNDYKIYTGKETNLGTYEKLEGSTAATRKAAYNLFITNLYSGDQLAKGENTADIESTDYFARQLVSQYESAVLEKLNDKFEAEATENLGAAWAQGLYDDAVANQRAEYSADRAANKSAFEDAFNAISDSSFVFVPYDYEYGYVLNILLPFSTLQTEELNSFTNDFGDAKGAKYAARARLLEKVKATDQRGTWFTGHNDYSYEATEGYGIGENGRSYLFFENSLEKSDDVLGEGEEVVKSAQYEKIENYLGKYSYNGTVTRDEDGDVEKLDPNRITIDEFLSEMKGYMEYAGTQAKIDGGLSFTVSQSVPSDYYTRENFYDADDKVDYSKFLYEVGKIGYFQNNKFDPNKMFVEGTPENVAFSVINELSFAYNTDTAGLNSYLGYMISPYQTSYMKEFEYAAQLVVREGAGSYAVVPTDYGWHIIYCTFSFADVAKGEAAFTFDPDAVEGGANALENSFSWLYFDGLKSQVVESEVSGRQSDILVKYAEACSEKFVYVYKDLLSL